MVVDLQDPEARRLVDGRKLIESTGAQLEVLDVHLHGLAGDADVTAPPRTWAISLEGHVRHVVLLENPVDRRGRHVDLMVAGEKHREPLDSVLSFLPQAQDQSLELGWDAMGADAGAPAILAETLCSKLSVPRHPEVELAARNPEEPARQADVVRHLLVVPDDPEPRLRPPNLVGLPCRHPGSPFLGRSQHTPTVQE